MHDSSPKLFKIHNRSWREKHTVSIYPIPLRSSILQVPDLLRQKFSISHTTLSSAFPVNGSSYRINRRIDTSLADSARSTPYGVLCGVGALSEIRKRGAKIG
jgi:hypothetical protein